MHGAFIVYPVMTLALSTA